MIPNSSTLDIAYYETLNAITTAKRKKIVDKEKSKILFEALEELMKSLKVYEATYYVKDAFVISNEHNLSLYDSLYLSLALSLKAKIITLSDKQIKVASKLGIPYLEK